MEVSEYFMVARASNRKKATEFKLYSQIQYWVRQHPSSEVCHIIFDVSEKLILPDIRQSGKFHLKNGLKFDFFGVDSSNLETSLIFGFPDGYWPRGREESK